ncbi:E3 ubiquitin-protein ligase RNF115 isoform X1 [Trichogramma pretiosum]|uniref:E3 ubiquitin-protein ligase RNF115 isoform X1 n=1 Tax=Trichogramma pretiosum TaxID=7493 RepID=UPI0006C98785|nr:E3 ubiquitin-protein ligase RNF115 isoform X1 [Trichogramma pretiosum]
MAEAVVDGSSISRFFCHRCNTEIEHLLPDFTCPRCSSGFIEELDGDGPDDVADMDVANDLEFSAEAMGLPSFIIRTATQNSTRGNSSSSQPNSQSNRNVPPGVSPHIDSLIHELFFNRVFGFAQNNQAPVFDVRLFLGNPGDYVWGQNGLDTIVTQLLNQMDGTGPPPLPKHLIEEIPTSKITQEQVDSKLQCSVCWDDFVVNESVRQLPCQHHFHEPCIVPWLELHGTCPICRQSLGEQSTSEANQDSVGPNLLAALFQAAGEMNSSSSNGRTPPQNDTSNDI